MIRGSGLACAMVMTTQEENELVYYRILPVLLIKGNTGAASVMTYALYDNASTRCFVMEELLEDLNMTATQTTLRLWTMHGNELAWSRAVEVLHVTDMEGMNRISLLCTFSRPDIPVGQDQIPRAEVVAKWPYLRHVAICMPQHYNNMMVGLIIGSNCLVTMEPREVVPTQEDGPYTMRLAQGWTVYRPVGVSKARQDLVANRIVVRQVEDLRKLVVNMFERDCIDATHALNTDYKGHSVADKKFLEMMESETTFGEGGGTLWHYFL